MALSFCGKDRCCPGCGGTLHQRFPLGWAHDDGSMQCGSLIVRAA
jgi:hypothetical protein